MQLLIAVSLLLAGYTYAGTAQPDVIYGPDNRAEVYNSNSVHQTKASSTAAMISKNLFSGSQLLNVYTLGYNLEKKYGAKVCSDTKFTSQMNFSNCSGSLIAPDLILTAGHCVPQASSCTDNNWVFDYKLDSYGRLNQNLGSKNVYSCKKILSYKNASGQDYAIVQLDRVVEGRTPLEYRLNGKIADGETVYTIGTPAGLPLKVTTDGKVRTNNLSYYYTTTLDTFSGNSGSPVFNTKTNVIEGILVRGENDYVKDASRNCVIENKCTESGCRGEDVSRVTSVMEIGTYGAVSTIFADNGPLSSVQSAMPSDFWTDFPYYNGMTLSMLAVFNQRLDALKFLITRGGALRVKDQIGNSLLHYFGGRQNTDSALVEYLVKSGLSLEAKNNYGETPIIIAARLKNAQAVKVLFRAGADSTAKDSTGNYVTSYFKDMPQELAELRELGVWDPNYTPAPTPSEGKFQLLASLYDLSSKASFSKITSNYYAGRCFNSEDPTNMRNGAYIFLSSNGVLFGNSISDKDHPADYFDDKSFEFIMESYEDMDPIRVKDTATHLEIVSGSSVSKLKFLGSYMIEEYLSEGEVNFRCYYFMKTGMDPL